MKSLYYLIILITITSCIPLRIAPTIKEDKIVVAKKFKRSLPKQHAFVFEDKPYADEFYNYINTKFQLNHVNVTNNVPIIIENQTYFLSFYETEIPNKTLNLAPVLIDAKLENAGNDKLLEDAYVSRKDKWYILLTVFDKDIKNCLNSKHAQYEIVKKYLQAMRIEYLNTNNYLEVVFEKKP